MPNSQNHTDDQFDPHKTLRPEDFVNGDEHKDEPPHTLYSAGWGCLRRDDAAPTRYLRSVKLRSPPSAMTIEPIHIQFENGLM